jgi:hypothetical protein
MKRQLLQHVLSHKGVEAGRVSARASQPLNLANGDLTIFIRRIFARFNRTSTVAPDATQEFIVIRAKRDLPAVKHLDREPTVNIGIRFGRFNRLDAISGDAAEILTIIGSQSDLTAGQNFDPKVAGNIGRAFGRLNWIETAAVDATPVFVVVGLQSDAVAAVEGLPG